MQCYPAAATVAGVKARATTVKGSKNADAIPLR